MKVIKDISAVFIAFFIAVFFYCIYCLDKIATLLSHKSTPSFKAWVKDEYKLSLKTYSSIRVFVMVLIITLIWLF
jgi:hypothetical protein